MNIVVYHAKAFHPNHSHDIYEKIWPRFLESAHEHGYEITQLTGLEDRQVADRVLRYNIDPQTPMLSREICWVRYLRDADSSEEHCMLEPDFLIRRKIPPLKEGFDMMMLNRTGETVQTSIRIVRTTALPFYEAVLEAYQSKVDVKRHAWCGDCDAHHIVMGVPPQGKIRVMPQEWNGLKIEIRDENDYGNVWPKRADAVMWHYKGTSKVRMIP